MQTSRRTTSSRAATLGSTVALLLLLATPGPAQDPAAGMFLVATGEVRGGLFDETVVLLLHYGNDGALGLVVNRPMQAEATEVLPDLEGMEHYRGSLYWGGPVQIASLRALLRTDSPPAGAVKVLEEVYLVAPGGPLPAGVNDPGELRYFLGYAGWGPGQLDGELVHGSWHLVEASSEAVFDADAASIWRRLTPPEAIRVALPRKSAAVD
ncbi:MAG: YqgE/AlgH family protein [Woeseiaceae bacterium]|nr:YqgE/AlgH family protein [Woeseiaceae bacterium]